MQHQKLISFSGHFHNKLLIRLQFLKAIEQMIVNYLDVLAGIALSVIEILI
jgi:hypothetical protein